MSSIYEVTEWWLQYAVALISSVLTSIFLLALV